MLIWDLDAEKILNNYIVLQFYIFDARRYVTLNNVHHRKIIVNDNIVHKKTFKRELI